MADFDVVPYSSENFDGVEAPRGEAFPDDPLWNRAEVAIPAKLAVQPELFLVALNGDRVIGCIIAGYDGHRVLALCGGRLECLSAPRRRDGAGARSGGPPSINGVQQNQPTGQGVKPHRCRFL